MPNQSAAIVYFGPDRPGLMSQIIGYLDAKGGRFANTTFSALGQHGAELTLIYDIPDSEDTRSLEQGLRALPVVEGGEITVKSVTLQRISGPSKRITHRFTLFGGDYEGHLVEVIRVLDDNGGIIVRMDTERLEGSKGRLYISRFAISLRPTKGPACLAALGELCGKKELTFRYETA